MPFKNPEDMKKYQMAYRAVMADKLRLQKRQAYLLKIEQYRKRMEKNNRKKGHKKRGAGAGGKLKVRVSHKRRYIIIPDDDGVDMVYFSKETGFKRSELLEIARQMLTRE